MAEERATPRRRRLLWIGLMILAAVLVAWAWRQPPLRTSDDIARLGGSAATSTQAGGATNEPRWLTPLVERAEIEGLFDPIVDIDLSWTDVRNADLRRLPDTRRLESLTLANTVVDDSGLTHLRNAASLCSIDLSDTRITGTGLANLPPPGPLNLSLRRVPLSLEGARCLAKLSNLSTLYLEGATVDDEKLAVIANCKSLRILDISNTPISDVGMSHLRHLRNLDHLYLSDTHVTGAGVLHLEDLISLAALRLSGCNVSDAGLQAISRLPKLSELDLCGTRVSDVGFREYAYRSLRELSLADTAIGDDAIMALLPKSTSLRALDLTGTRITGKALVALRNTQVEVLHLNSCALRDADLVHVARMPALRGLALCNTPIGDAGIAHLAKCSKLTELLLANTNVSRTGLETLGTGPRLAALDLSGTAIGDGDTKALLTWRGTLSSLRLAGTAIGDAAADSLARMTALNYLDLSRTRIGDETLRKLAVVTELAALDLVGVDVTDAGLRDAARCPNLRHLYLGERELPESTRAALRNVRPELAFRSSLRDWVASQGDGGALSATRIWYRHLHSAWPVPEIAR